MDVTLEVDKFGRVLFPKKLREALHLQPGEKLRAHLEGDLLTVTPEPRAATLREHNGFLLVDLPGESVLQGDPVEEAREARIREVLGEW